MTRRGAWSVAVGILPALLLSGALSAAEPVRNGFVLEPASIPAAEILGGGPPRDGIPALDHPTTLPAAQADWSDDDLVLGVVVSGAARAYPVGILNWHELVNDEADGARRGLCAWKAHTRAAPPCGDFGGRRPDPVGPRVPSCG